MGHYYIYFQAQNFEHMVSNKPVNQEIEDIENYSLYSMSI